MELDSQFINFKIRDKILVCTYQQGLSINQFIASEIVRKRIAFTGKRKFATLIISRGVVTIDKAAREYLSSVYGTEGLLASAIVVDSVFGSFLGNFFLAVNKTSMPVKLFTSELRAEKWLKQFIV